MSVGGKAIGAGKKIILSPFKKIAMWWSIATSAVTIAIAIFIVAVLFGLVTNAVAAVQPTGDLSCVAGSAYIPNAPGNYDPNPTVINIAYSTAQQVTASLPPADQAKVTLALFMAIQRESGYRNLANDKVPDSLTIPHDNYTPNSPNGSDGYSVGVLQQQVNGNQFDWGTAAQAMDVAHASSSFLTRAMNALATTPGDAADLAQEVQGSAWDGRGRASNGYSNEVGGNYRALAGSAQGYVNKAATGQIGNSTGTNSSGASCTAATTLVATCSSTAANAATCTIGVTSHGQTRSGQNLSTTGQKFVISLPVGTDGKPNEAGLSIKAAVEEVDKGMPYTYAGGTVNGPSLGQYDGEDSASLHDNRVNGFDCSGLTMYAIAQGTNQRIVLPHQASAQQNDAQFVQPTSKPSPGDLMFFEPKSDGSPGHVTMYLGLMNWNATANNGVGEWESSSDNTGTAMMAQAPQSGELLNIVPISSHMSNFMGYGHVAYNGTVAGN